MTKEQFLSAVNDIDDKFVNEIINERERANDPSGTEPAGGRPQVIYLQNKRVPFKMIALSAVLVCAITAGVLISIKLSSVTLSQGSGANLSGSQSDPISVSVSVPEKNDIISASYKAAFEALIEPDGGNKTFISDPVRKPNSRGFAEISFKCRGVGEDNPLYISVCRKEGENYHAVTDEIKFTGGGLDKIVINYTEPVGAGDGLALMIRAENGNAFAAGLWDP